MYIYTYIYIKEATFHDFFVSAMLFWLRFHEIK